MSTKSKSFKRPKPPRTTLEQDIASAKQVHPKNRNKKRSRDEGDDEFLDAKISRKIISRAREQLFEDEESTLQANRTPILRSQEKEGDDSLSEDDLEPDMFFENIVVNPEDEEAYEQFMNENPAPRRNLADYILEKRSEKEKLIEEQLSVSGTVVDLADINPATIEMYQCAAELLKTYKSGKFPKLMKFLPTLKCFEVLLDVTDPSCWSAASIYTITRIWVSNLGYEKLKIFYRYVLLPRIRDEITGNQRLNFHLYQAVRKALYKPKAFVLEFLLPLCESGDCTLREAIIIGSILARNSIPAQHSMVAIIAISDMDYCGANSIFLRILLDKKYSLSTSVIQAVLAHFLRFMFDKRTLPVLWHQCLLTFVQRYKTNIYNEEGCEGLLEVVNKHSHELITPEIIRELDSVSNMQVDC